MSSSYKIFSDGGSRGNPGVAAYGWLLFDQNNQLITFNAQYLGIQTNNYAEYMGILNGLKAFKKLQQKEKLVVNKLECYLDSELIVKQLNGEYRVKNRDLSEIYSDVIKVTDDLETNYEFIHIRREKNKFADRLVNICLDANQK